jgi:hypothetical protein
MLTLVVELSALAITFRLRQCGREFGGELAGCRVVLDSPSAALDILLPAGGANGVFGTKGVAAKIRAGPMRSTVIMCD